jgi:HD superfamily phosphodiesterase
MQKVKLEKTLYGYVESARDQEKGTFTTYVINTNTQNGKIAFKFWNLNLKNSLPKQGDFLKINCLDLDEASKELEMYKTISLDSTSKKPYYCEYQKINAEEVPSDLIKLIFKDRSKQLNLAAELLKDSSFWTSKDNYKFLMETLKVHLEKFTTVPAAISHHHNYKGGLFIHSSEVFSNCYSIVNSACNKKFYLNNLDLDALYLSAWLHDLGKIDIYFLDGDVAKMDPEKENLIGHPTISNNYFIESANKFGLEKDFINKVSHCILSHHRKPKWGAVIRPQTKEAEILCNADLISSRISD